MSAIGYGSLMGLLKNYEVINPFVSATNDSLNRLKPGFEAPVCVVTSLGHTPEIPSRNRTILAGLIRDLSNPYATRFVPRPRSYLLGLPRRCQGLRHTHDGRMPRRDFQGCR